MKINVTNKVKNLNVTVDETTDGFEIRITEKKEEDKETKTLGSVAPGNIVTIGKHEYIVLGHTAETTALLDVNKIDERVFDDDDSNYETSDIRKYLNDTYYKELCATVGKENIIKHRVDLEAEDGTNKGEFCEDFVSLITIASYRLYREHIPAAGYPWWTATRVTTADKDYYRRVCYVHCSGVLCWSICDGHFGIRPFCILNSSISVSCNQ